MATTNKDLRPWIEGMVEAVLKQICHTTRIDVRKPVDNIIRLFFQCVNIIDEPEQLARKICWVVVRSESRSKMRIEHCPQ